MTLPAIHVPLEQQSLFQLRLVHRWQRWQRFWSLT